MSSASSIKPTVSDISEFMYKLGYKWSNDAGCYYHVGMLYSLIDTTTARLLYEKIVMEELLEQ